MYDSNWGVLVTAATGISSSSNSAAYNLTPSTAVANALITYPGEVPLRGYRCRIDLSSIGGTTPTYLFYIESSATSGGTYTIIAGMDGGAVSVNGEYFILFYTQYSFIKLYWTATGTLPTATLLAEVGLEPQAS